MITYLIPVPIDSMRELCCRSTCCPGRNLGPHHKKYGTCQFGSFLRRRTSPLSLPALPYAAPIFSARASRATVADAVFSLSNVLSRPRDAFDT